MTNKDAIWVLELIRDRYSALDIERLSLTDAETDAINTAIAALDKKHGEWIPTDDIDIDFNRLYECSNCHHSDRHSETVEVPYCWYCGADMRGERG